MNSYYNNSDKSTPSIYALKKLVKYFSNKKRLSFYLDLHSHFTKKGLFLFGNPLKKKNYKKILKFPFKLKNTEK